MKIYEDDGDGDGGGGGKRMSLDFSVVMCKKK